LSPGLGKNCRSFASQEDFNQKSGTKLKTLVELISFFVKYGNAVDPVLDAKGTLKNDPSSLNPSDGSSVLVYCNWLRQVDLIHSALRVNDMNSESATSNDSVHVRNKTLMAFSSKKDRRGNPCNVLMISGVGTTGLNITTANVVIFAVCFFSQLS
jgi:SNF2 family DNA or RNA helicase